MQGKIYVGDAYNICVIVSEVICAYIEVCMHTPYMRIYCVRVYICTSLSVYACIVIYIH